MAQQKSMIKEKFPDRFGGKVKKEEKKNMLDHDETPEYEGKNLLCQYSTLVPSFQRRMRTVLLRHQENEDRKIDRNRL